MKDFAYKINFVWQKIAEVCIWIKIHRIQIWNKYGKYGTVLPGAFYTGRASYVDFPNPNSDINMLFEWLFSRVLDFHSGGPGSIPSRDMSVLEPLV